MDEPLYRIGEAARLLELETYVLRFWETEFPQLQPLRTPKGQRKYTQNHLELLQLVKHLLYQQGMTIEGARKILERKADPFASLGARTAGSENAENGNEFFGSDDEILPPPLPSPRAAFASGRRGEAQVKLVQGSLVPGNLVPGNPIQTPPVPASLPQPPDKDRKLLRDLRQELNTLRETLRDPIPTSGIETR